MSEPTEPDEAPTAPDDPYGLPPEGDEPAALQPEDAPRRRRSGGGGALNVALLLLAVALVLGAWFAYRTYHRGRVVSEGIARAETQLRLDTAAGYRDAARDLEPLAEMDPVRAGSVRAFALAMLFADYRDPAAEDAAETLLVAPGRADEVPPHANLAYAALALGRREAGNAATASARAGDVPWAHALQARVALLAANLEAGADPAARAAAAELPAGLAMQGELLRRTRRDLAGARAAYEAALAASPLHPRSAFGLAKLALGGQADPASARAALERLLDDATGTPGAERGRAAIHLTALLLRGGDPSPFEPLRKAQLTGASRAWAEAAARAEAEHRGPYRAVAGAPQPLQSASDDDPADLPPWRPPPPPPPPPAKPAVAKKPAAKPPAKTAPAKKPPAKASSTTKSSTKR